MLLTTIFCFLPLSKIIAQNLFVLPVGRRGSLMLSVTIFCSCPCQYLLYISALTAWFAYVVGCCILPLPLSAFIAYYFVNNAVCNVIGNNNLFFAPVKDYRKVFNNTRRRLRKPTLPVGRRGSLMLSVTIFCYCPCQYLLYISALTARFAYVVGCCILPLLRSAFTAYFLLTARFVTLQNPTKAEKTFSKNRR